MEVRLVAPSAPEILAVEPALAIGFDRGIFVGIYRAPMQGQRVEVLRRRSSMRRRARRAGSSCSARSA